MSSLYHIIRGNARYFILFIAIFVLFYLMSLYSGVRKNKDVTSHQIQTSDQAIKELKNGNLRFLSNTLIRTNYAQQIEETKAEQHPHTMILSCMDSRVPPEIIFDQGIGNLFVARVAGNIEDEAILGSLEFATKIKHAKLVVVLGHSRCGAIKGAMENAHLEHLTPIVNQIKAAILPSPSYPLQDEVMDVSSKQNIKITIADILRKSVTLRQEVQDGELKIVGAFYDVGTGKVYFL
jgi:carbonic anhydrase